MSLRSAKTGLLFLLGMNACMPSLSLDNRSCPCAAGWQCCASGNLCVAEGQSCPSSPDGGMDAGANAVWTPEMSGTTNPLHAIWGSSKNDVYAVGEGRIILHSTGKGDWSLQPSRPPGHYYGIWGSGPNDIYAVGWPGVLAHSTGDGTWTTQWSDSSVSLHGVWGSGQGDVFAVGAKGSRGIILHSKGDGNWVSQEFDSWLVGVWGFPANPYFANAYGDNLLKKNDNSFPTSWTSLNNTPMGAQSIWVNPAGTLAYAVGAKNILRWNNPWITASWQVESTSEQTLMAVWLSGDDDIFVVGEQGTVLHSSGGIGHFITQATGTTANLNGVWGSGPGDVYIVGDNGTILHQP